MTHVAVFTANLGLDPNMASLLFLQFRSYHCTTLLQAMLDDLTRVDVYFGRAKEVLDLREVINRWALETRRRHHVR